MRMGLNTIRSISRLFSQHAVGDNAERLSYRINRLISSRRSSYRYSAHMSAGRDTCASSGLAQLQSMSTRRESLLESYSYQEQRTLGHRFDLARLEKQVKKTNVTYQCKCRQDIEQRRLEGRNLCMCQIEKTCESDNECSLSISETALPGKIGRKT